MGPIIFLLSGEFQHTIHPSYLYYIPQSTLIRGFYGLGYYLVYDKSFREGDYTSNLDSNYPSQKMVWTPYLGFAK